MRCVFACAALVSFASFASVAACAPGFTLQVELADQGEPLRGDDALSIDFDAPGISARSVGVDQDGVFTVESWNGPGTVSFTVVDEDGRFEDLSQEMVMSPGEFQFISIDLERI